MYIFFVYLSDKLFGNKMILLLQLGIIIEFLNSLHVLLVLVRPRPANCDYLMELGQRPTSAIFSRIPETYFKRRSCCDLKYLGMLPLVLSRCKLFFCQQFSSRFL